MKIMRSQLVRLIKEEASRLSKGGINGELFELVDAVREEVERLHEVSRVSGSIVVPVQAAVDHMQAAIIELRKVIPSGPSYMGPHQPVADSLTALQKAKTTLFLYLREL